MAAVKEAIELKATERAMTDAHHILRTIGTAPNLDGTITGDQADALLRTWFENGYTLFSTHYAGDTPHGVRMLYVLVKYEPA